MIKSNELRIGNWVDLKNSGYVKVDADNIGDIVNNPAIFDPIPLTPEILEKAGFEKGKTQSSGYYGYSNGIVTLDNDFALGLYDGRMDDPSTKEYYPETKYLHQLQNLYWCLCGSELDIKLQ